jgi:para-aminobenzoate synthetase component 1
MSGDPAAISGEIREEGMQPNVPLAEEIACRDAIALAAGATGSPSPWTLLFDSAAPDDPRGRYSYLCLDPAERLAVPAEAMESPADGTPPAPLAWLSRRLGAWPQLRRPDLPPFQGGAAGLLSYEFGGWLECPPTPHEEGAPHPLVALGIYDVVVAIDHAADRAWIVSTGYPESDPARRSARARERLEAVRAQLGDDTPKAAGASALRLDWRSDTPRAAYLAKVQRTIDYIHAGDAFQVNLSRELVAPRPRDLEAFELYSDMRRRTQAPFSAFFALADDMAVCSFSPERFVQVGAEGTVETRPIKGTRPRGRDAVSDARLAAELTQSGKDRAENLMIVDLLRNDLGRVCRIGSIAVPQLCGLESFGAVHHLVSVVTGRLGEGRGSVDLVGAAFPGGSITGAPKIRAMEIIHELEGRRRGPYCGSLCWLGFDGSMDSSILIRTMAVDGGHVRYGVGGGIVADSDPEDEWRETEVKAAAFVGAPETETSDALLP